MLGKFFKNQLIKDISVDSPENTISPALLMKKQLCFQNGEPWVTLPSEPLFSYIKMGVINMGVCVRSFKLSANIKRQYRTNYMLKYT